MKIKRRINVYELLRDKIIQGAIPQGEALREEWLTGQLKVSRTPIREALIRLQENGLVTLIKNKGAFVASFGTNDILEIFSLRILLEGFAAQSCVDFMVQPKMQNIYNGMEKLVNVPGRFDEKVKAGTDLHALIIECAGNARLQKIITTLQTQVMWVRFRAERIPGRVDQSLQEHLKIVKAILSHDGKQAGKCMKKHLEDVLKDLTDAKNLKVLSGFRAGKLG